MTIPDYDKYPNHKINKNIMDSKSQQDLITRQKDIENSNRIELEQNQLDQDLPKESKYKYKVYLAILNHGWLRSEMTYNMIPQMLSTPTVKVFWENPDLTWAHPISSNRNKIVKRFLNTNCTHLLMIDDDVVPYDNPVELVYADQDIIGIPAKVRSEGQMICWVAYVPHVSGDGYSAVNLDEVDSDADLIEVDVIGTGCILIKRQVLEKLKAPFHLEFDEDGIHKYGTDFAFCRKAKDAGFKVFITTQRRCEHYKELGINDIDSYDQVRSFDKSNTLYKIPWGGYAITVKDWHFIKDVINQIKKETKKEFLSILEFGSGLSSLLMSQGNKVISYETDKKWADEILFKRITIENEVSINNLEIRIWNGTQLNGEDENELISDPPDLIFVDGPKGGINRDAAIKFASIFGTNVILHDAGREAELHYQRKHLHNIFKIVSKSGDHVTRCVWWKKNILKKEINNGS